MKLWQKAYKTNAEDDNGKSLMNDSQKTEIDKRSKLYKQGKLKTSSWEEVKKRVRKMTNE